MKKMHIFSLVIQILIDTNTIYMFSSLMFARLASASAGDD